MDEDICDVLAALCPPAMPFCTRKQFDLISASRKWPIEFDALTADIVIDVATLFSGLYGQFGKNQGYFEVVRAWKALFCETQVSLDEFMSILSIEGMNSHEILIAATEINSEKWNTIAVWQLMRSKNTDSGRRIISIADSKNAHQMETDSYINSQPMVFRKRCSNPVITQLDNFVSALKKIQEKQGNRDFSSGYSSFYPLSSHTSQYDTYLESSYTTVKPSLSKIDFDKSSMQKLQHYVCNFKSQIPTLKQSVLTLDKLSIPKSDLKAPDFTNFFISKFLKIHQESYQLIEFSHFLFCLMLTASSDTISPGRCLLGCLMPVKCSLLDKVRFTAKYANADSFDLLSVIVGTDSAASIQASIKLSKKQNQGPAKVSGTVLSGCQEIITLLQCSN